MCGDFGNWQAMSSVDDARYMARAVELASRGEGHVEPNPMVGCVIVRDGHIVGEGWHRQYGGPHAEIVALHEAGPSADGATLYVTLEPCCHHGKTPPCTEAVIAAGVARVVVAQQDPFPQVAGQGLRQLQEAGIQVRTGLLEAEAARLTAPYRKLLGVGRPWVLAKWAMTLDGKMATRQGESRWISNERSRAVVHRLRGRVDGILVGQRTAALDDPSLTARPPGSRVPLRIVLDSEARLSDECQLVASARETPVLVVVGQEAAGHACQRLRSAGCEVISAGGDTPAERIRSLLDELGSRCMTNLLVEGGGRVLGAFQDAGEIDEVHVFVAPKIFGGVDAVRPFAGDGVQRVADALRIEPLHVELLDSDVYLHGRVT
jgi:diaminohydroxyphosphoribosylaminopyrimidine deaminase/5-amino-6-(5-phosphoribosylamino)uracil reductase